MQPTTTRTYTDPICGMAVDPAKALTTRRDGVHPLLLLQAMPGAFRKRRRAAAPPVLRSLMSPPSRLGGGAPVRDAAGRSALQS